MLTDEEAKKHARELNKYCDNKKCPECPFANGVFCVIYNPAHWELEVTNG